MFLEIAGLPQSNINYKAYVLFCKQSVVDQLYLKSNWKGVWEIAIAKKPIVSKRQEIMSNSSLIRLPFITAMINNSKLNIS